MDLQDGSLGGIYTLQKPDGDVLVARWNSGGADRPEKAVWLWDTPTYTVFLMEVDPSVYQPTAMAQYCEGLFQWEKFIHLKSAALSLDSTGSRPQTVTGTTVHDTTQYGTYRLWLAGQAANSGAIVSAWMTKYIFSNDYPREAVHVPERFPPLSDRLHSVPRSAIFDEIGKGYSPNSLLSYPTERDAIVIAELLSRGKLSDAEVRQIIVGNFDTGDYQGALIAKSRLDNFLRAAEAARQLTVYASPLTQILTTIPIHQAEAGLIGGAVATMHRNGVDFSAVLFDLIEQKRFVRENLQMLRLNFPSEVTAERLVKTPVPAEFEAEKQRTIKLIHEHLVKLSKR